MCLLLPIPVSSLLYFYSYTYQPTVKTFNLPCKQQIILKKIPYQMVKCYGWCWPYNNQKPNLQLICGAPSTLFLQFLYQACFYSCQLFLLFTSLLSCLHDKPFSSLAFPFTTTRTVPDKCYFSFNLHRCILVDYCHLKKSNAQNITCMCLILRM